MASGFLESALAGALKLNVGSATAELVAALNDQRASAALLKVRFLLVTDTKLSDRVRELPSEVIADVPCEFQVWDIDRLGELQEEAMSLCRSTLQEFGDGISCLPVHLPTSDYRSYLCVVPGHLLAELYGRFGARLLETNVRGFLSDRGKVNRGLRATIQNRPHMFFAYNNGLTATATDIKTRKINGEERIEFISDLQIVNGGQTTASMFWAKKKHKASLDGVFIQMKMSVIPPEMSDQFDQIVSDISNLPTVKTRYPTRTSLPIIRFIARSRRSHAGPVSRRLAAASIKRTGSTRERGRSIRTSSLLLPERSDANSRKSSPKSISCPRPILRST